MPETTADARELQATACLKAAETHHARLLAVARKLAGSDEGGRELFQQTVLNCHDAIQRWGYNGDRYEFYLLASLKNLAQKFAQQARRTPAVDLQQFSEANERVRQAEDSGTKRHYNVPGLYTKDVKHVTSYLAQSDVLLPAHDPLADLVGQVQEEIRTQFSPADRIALRLHIDGESYRDIAALVGGGDHSWISRRVAKMKTALRDAFGQAWANLHAE